MYGFEEATSRVAEEWIVTVINEHSTTAVKGNGRVSKESAVRVRAHQGSVTQSIIISL